MEEQERQAFYEKWIPIEEAVRSIPGQAKTPLLIRLESGLITAMAKVIVSQTSRGSGTPSKFYGIRADVWKKLHDGNSAYGNSVWENGDLVIIEGNTGSLYDSGTVYKYLKIRLDPEEIADLLPPKPKPIAPPSPAKHAGGAPPKDIWESVWVHIAARLINGDLDPKQQKDIQEAIEDWGVAHNDPISESTAKRHAKLLWSKIKSGS